MQQVWWHEMEVRNPQKRTLNYLRLWQSANWKSTFTYIYTLYLQLIFLCTEVWTCDKLRLCLTIGQLPPNSPSVSHNCHINKGQHILQSANWLLSSFEKDMNHIELHCKAVPGQTDCLFPLVPLPFCKATSSKAAAKLRQFEGFEHRSMIQPAPVGWTTSTAFLMRSTYDEWIWAFQSAEIPWFITIFPCQGC